MRKFQGPSFVIRSPFVIVSCHDTRQKIVEYNSILVHVFGLHQQTAGLGANLL